MLEAGGALDLCAKAKLVNRDRCTAWGTDLIANFSVSEENEALLLQTDLHLTVAIWAENFSISLCRDLKTLSCQTGLKGKEGKNPASKFSGV